MAQSQPVKILEVCKVAPPPDLPPHSGVPKSLPLTLFDLFWLRLPPFQNLIFYEVPSLQSDSIIPKLKQSLSLTLHHYLPLAGNLTWPQHSHRPIINYVDGDRVSLTIADSNMDFYHLTGYHFRRETDYHLLLPQLEVSDERAAAMALQVTLFPNCGFSIGITSHHAVLDGKTWTLFIKSWAQICKAGADSPSLLPELTPFYDREVIKDPTGLDSIYITEWLKQGGPNNRSLIISDSVAPPDDLVRATFEFTRDHIQKLRQSVCANQSNPAVHITGFSIACALILVCVVKAAENVKEKKAKFVFGVDCRYRLKPAIPATYFGNCVIGRPAVVETKDLVREDGILSALEGISEAITSLDDGVLLDGADSWASLINSAEPGDEIPPTACIAWSPRFQVYNTDFGWGTPTKFEMTSIHQTGAICMSDSKSGNGGFEIGMVSQMKKIEAFASAFAKALNAL